MKLKKKKKRSVLYLRQLYDIAIELYKNVNEFFENLLNSQGFYTADGVAQEIKGLLTEFSSVETIDYWLGKQTNVGIRRNLNEDSLLTIEISRILFISLLMRRMKAFRFGSFLSILAKNIAEKSIIF